MPDSVVARVADRLDIQPEQTDRVLRTLAQLIKKQSARDGRVRVPGLGVFQQTTDLLSFEPDTALSEAINHRYVGLHPVPLSQELETAEPASEKAIEETPDFSLMPPLPDDLEDFEEEATPETLGEEPAEIEVVEETMEAEAVKEEPMAREEALEEEPDDVDETVAHVVIDEEEPEVEEEALAEIEVVEEAAAEVEEVEEVEETMAEDVTDDVLEAVDEAVAEEDTVEEEPMAEDAFGEEEMIEEETIEEQGVEEEPVAVEQPAVEGLGEEDAEEPDAEDALFAPPLVPFDYNNPDISEAAAYAKLRGGTEPAEEDTLSEWAPDETSWSQEGLGGLLQEVDQEELVADETPSPQMDIPDREAESKEENKEEEAEAVVSLDRSPDLPPKPHPARKVHTREPPRRRSALPWLLLITAVIVIGATLYFMFGPPSKTTGNTTQTAAEETPPPAIAEPATSATENTEEAPEDTTGETTTAEAPSPTPPEETPAEPAAASSGRIDLSRGGYTLVVGSSTEQAVAEAQAERIRQRFGDLSLPIDVLTSTSDGATRYRVVVGQVPTVEEAVALRDRHSANLPEGTWATNIARVISDG